MNTEENNAITPEAVQVEMFETLLKLSYQRGVLMGACYGCLGFATLLWATAFMVRYFS